MLALIYSYTSLHVHAYTSADDLNIKPRQRGSGNLAARHAPVLQCCAVRSWPDQLLQHQVRKRKKRMLFGGEARLQKTVPT
jgi:hypothetical protein